MAYPDTLVGTDSHTTMVNGLGVVGWGVGGIEAEACMLGQPISMLVPEVLGVRLTGRLPDGVDGHRPRADDHRAAAPARRRREVRRVLRAGPRAPVDCRPRDAQQHVPGVRRHDRRLPDRRDDARLPAADRAGRAPRRAGRGVREGAGAVPRARRRPRPTTPSGSSWISAAIEPSLAGPRRPQDRVTLGAGARVVRPGARQDAGGPEGGRHGRRRAGGRGAARRGLDHGAVVIAAITSCTNTSNPSVMIAAGLLAKKAVERGLRVKPWVKTSLAPGSKAVTDYLASGRPDAVPRSARVPASSATAARRASATAARCRPRSAPTSKARDLVVASVLSGNRNFEGRIQSQVRANYLASPPLVVAYALAGTMRIDLTTRAARQGRVGRRRLPAGHLAVASARSRRRCSGR